MSDPVKFSPLCHAEDGAVYFTARVAERKLRIRFSKSLLDGSCGPVSSDSTRDAWVKDQKPHLAASLADGTALPSALDGIRIEEMT